MTNNLIRQWADYNDAASLQKAVAQRSGWIRRSKFLGSRSKSSLMGAGAWLAVRRSLQAAR